MNTTFPRGLVAAALAAALVCAGSTHALAYWLTPGRGAGAALTGDAGVVVALQPVTGLAPGSTATQSGLLLAASATPVRISALTAGARVDAGHATCDPTSYLSLTAAAGTTAPVIGPATPATVSVSITMSPSAPNACQGADFTISLDAAGTTA